MSALVALGVAACGSGSPAASRSDPPRHAVAAHSTAATATTTTTTVPVTATTAPAVATTTTAPGAAHGPITSPPLPAAGPGFVADHVTAVGDSVMIDYQGALARDIPGVAVTAVVGRGWTNGESALAQLKSEGQLGAVVIVGLGTNGPITSTQFDAMMSILSGASRVVFVNTHVDREWQDPNNSVLAVGASRNTRAFVVDWKSLAELHPTWLYSTGTHLPIDGPGAQALAALVAGVA